MKRITILIIAIAFVSLSLSAQEENNKIKIEKKSKNAVVKVKPDSDVVVIINEKKYDSEILDFIDSEKIESINVLKGAKAKEKYDSESVIVIKTKLVPPKEKIVIRGSGSLDGDQKPLFVIDGEVKESNFDLDSILPDDIESITVLKDEKAIKLYGKPAANGVIIIEMKKWKKKK